MSLAEMHPAILVAPVRKQSGGGYGFSRCRLLSVLLLGVMSAWIPSGVADAGGGVWGALSDPERSLEFEIQSTLSDPLGLPELGASFGGSGGPDFSSLSSRPLTDPESELNPAGRRATKQAKRIVVTGQVDKNNGLAASQSNSVEKARSSSPREAVLPRFTPARQSNLLAGSNRKPASPHRLFEVPLLAVMLVAGLLLSLWASTGLIRIRPGEQYCVLNYSGVQKTFSGPHLLFRPWPFYECKLLDSGPRSLTVHGIQALTSDGFRPMFSICVVYGATDQESPWGRDHSETIRNKAISAFTQAIGEVTLPTFISQQRAVGALVVSDVQQGLSRWNIQIHSVEVLEVGRIHDSSIRKSLPGNAGMSPRIGFAISQAGDLSVVGCNRK